jgi:hypothetical protein
MSNKGQKENRPLSLEEQRDEARKDKTGRIRRYLDLAEKFFNSIDADDDAAPNPA